jgi:DNA-binding transcriptional MerR regulator
MAKESGAGGAAEAKRNMTLTEVAKQTKISMPTLQKYKKRYADRIPSVGKGRSQRYPPESLAVFRQLRDENMARRGRPRKDGSAPGSATPRKRGRTAGSKRPAKASRRGRPRKSPGGEGLLTLTQIAQATKISYPTLLRYVKTSLDRIPHVGSGRRRRFKSDAVAVFQKLRGESRRGRPPGSKTKRVGGTGAHRGRPPGSGRTENGAMSRLSALVEQLQKRLAQVERELKKPLQLVRR